ncbi:MAG TPA: hypothetical protein VLK35_05595 [Methylomirabilota bacterium]|nr:hypothetical protein [Methylomirabilota bacterium]
MLARLADAQTSNLELRYGDRPLLREAVGLRGPVVSGIKTGEEIVAYLLGSIRLQALIEALEQADPFGDRGALRAGAGGVQESSRNGRLAHAGRGVSHPPGTGVS